MTIYRYCTSDFHKGNPKPRNWPHVPGDPKDNKGCSWTNCTKDHDVPWPSCPTCGGFYEIARLVPMEPGIYVTGDFDSVGDMFEAAQAPNRNVTFQWVNRPGAEIGGDK